MEIKKLDNEIINEYPKMNEFNKKELKNYIPQKWMKFGLSSFVFGILMKTTKSNAMINETKNTLELDGFVQQQVPGVLEKIDPMYEALNKGTEIFKFLSALLLLTSIILTTVKKYKNKERKSTKITNKKLKILYIITGISIMILVGIMIWANIIR